MPSTVGYEQPIQKRLNKEIKERLEMANRRLVRGQEYRQRVREPLWRQSMKQYEGDTKWGQINPDDPTADVVQVNLSFSTINTLIPFVADEDPFFTVHPYSGDSNEQHAQLLETFINRLWQSNDVQGTVGVRDAAFDWLVFGDGYIEVSWFIDDEEIYDQMGTEIENRVEIAQFRINALSPWDVWIDPYSDGIYNARWVIVRKVVPIMELEEDDRFTIPKSENITGIDTRNLGPGDEQRLLNSEDSSDWVTLYEYYDLKEKWMLTFVEGGQTAVRYIKGIQCPVIQVSNYRIPNSPYHMGELEQMAPLQEELNKTRSQMITARRRNIPKWIVRKQALDEDAEQAMKSGKMFDIIGIEGNDPFDNIIKSVVAQPLPPDLYQVDERIMNDINEVTGVNEYLRGVPQNISRTATEATIIEGSTNIRTRHKLLQVELAHQRTGQILLDIMRDVLPLTDFEEQTLYVTGREAERLNRTMGMEDPMQNATLTPTPEIFEGRYEVRVERGSTELRNPEVKAEQLRNMVQMMLSATPLLMQIGVQFNIRHLLELWFEAEGIDDVEALFQEDEGQAIMQQLQMMQQAQAAMGNEGPGQPQNGAPSQVVGGAATQPGQPRPDTAMAPGAMPDEGNSGILAPR
jgi:hypothetical protein